MRKHLTILSCLVILVSAPRCVSPNPNAFPIKVAVGGATNGVAYSGTYSNKEGIAVDFDLK